MDRLAVQRYLVDEKKMYDDVADALCERHGRVIDECNTTYPSVSIAASVIIDFEKQRLGVDALPLTYFNPDA